MCLCDQSLVNLAFLWKKLSQPQFYKNLTRKTAFFEGWSWFKFNNLGLALGTNLKFYISVKKELKLKVRKFWGLIHTFPKVTGEKLVGGPFCPPPAPSWMGWRYHDNLVSIVVNAEMTKLVSVELRLMVSNMRSETKVSRFESGYKLSAEVIPL